MERNVGFTQCARYTCLEDLQQATSFSTISGLNLDYCGEERCEPGFCFGPYVRENYLIHIVLAGKGVYQFDGKKYELTKGQAFLIYPGEETVYQADGKEPWQYVWVGFHGYRAEEFLENMGFSKECPVVTIQNLEQISNCMEIMLDAHKLTVAHELMRMSQLMEIFSIIMENNKKEEPQNDYPSMVYVRYAMDYMQMHFKEKVKIDDIAERIGISRSHLCNTFKKELKMTPQEYLIKLRMEHAASLLKNTAEPIQIVAAESGYEDSLSFSKVFKQKFQMSPKEFRNVTIAVVNQKEKGGYTGTCPL